MILVVKHVDNLGAVFSNILVKSGLIASNENNNTIYRLRTKQLAFCCFAIGKKVKLIGFDFFANGRRAAPMLLLDIRYFLYRTN